MSGEISKHVFLDYAEYQRLLEGEKKLGLLMTKVRELEAKLAQLQKSGAGTESNLSALVAQNEEKHELEPPLAGVISSITFPPSSRLDPEARKQQEKAEEKAEEKWYFLGIP